MPVISRFYGIIIFMFWLDHAPPHFHAKYGDDEAIIEIKTGAVSGNINKRALKMIEEWRRAHQDELLRDWRLAENKKELFTIKPLE